MLRKHYKRGSRVPIIYIDCMESTNSIWNWPHNRLDQHHFCCSFSNRQQWILKSENIYITKKWLTFIITTLTKSNVDHKRDYESIEYKTVLKLCALWSRHHIITSGLKRPKTYHVSPWMCNYKVSHSYPHSQSYMIAKTVHDLTSRGRSHSHVCYIFLLFPKFTKSVQRFTKFMKLFDSIFCFVSSDANIDVERVNSTMD